MRKSRHAIMIIMSFLFGVLLSSATLAKNSQLEFESSIVAVAPTSEDQGVVTITVQGFEVPVVVTPDTKLKGKDDEISLADLSVGDIVKIEAFFAEAGAIFADEIKIEEKQGDDFRLKGGITDVQLDVDGAGTAQITLLGIAVLVDTDTRITIPGSGNDVLPSDLLVGDQVKVRGSFDGSSLQAERIIVGAEQLGEMEIDGVVTSLTAEGFILDINQGGTTTIVLDADTEIKGELIEGASVRVEGMLNAELGILASEVTVRGNGNGNGNGNGEEEEED